MEKTNYQLKATYLATATAFLLTIPQFADMNTVSPIPADYHEFEPLANISKSVSEALASSVYTRTEPGLFFSLLTEVATHLIKESKPLDHDFATVVQKGFWNLLQ